MTTPSLHSCTLVSFRLRFSDIVVVLCPTLSSYHFPFLPARLLCSLPASLVFSLVGCALPLSPLFGGPLPLPSLLKTMRTDHHHHPGRPRWWLSTRSRAEVRRWQTPGRPRWWLSTKGSFFSGEEKCSHFFRPIGATVDLENC